MDIDFAKALRCAELSQQIYKDDSSELFDGFETDSKPLHDAKTDTQCAVLFDRDRAIVVFRGSERKVVDWQTNFDTSQERASFDREVIDKEIVDADCLEQTYPYGESSSSNSKMHGGFVNAYFSVREQIHQLVRDRDLDRITTTGHSLGGALATLCAVDLQYNFSEKVTQIEAYTYGSPRVGNEGFRSSFNQRVPNSYRFVHGMDIVPALPRWWQGQYRHVDREYRIGDRFRWNLFAGRFKDHAIGKYIEMLEKYV
ncbi:MAG: lipase family protein [Cyanobacteria bacterium J06648_11]